MNPEDQKESENESNKMPTSLSIILLITVLGIILLLIELFKIRSSEYNTSFWYLVNAFVLVLTLAFSIAFAQGINKRMIWVTSLYTYGNPVIILLPILLVFGMVGYENIIRNSEVLGKLIAVTLVQVVWYVVFLYYLRKHKSFFNQGKPLIEITRKIMKN
ncbi:MAG: hypothetical protein Q7S92_05900 [Candidatus Diapherotrites archaeon]|nr:hypothetical protein [Candidatus Diapherotrites archaeon]